MTFVDHNMVCVDVLTDVDVAGAELDQPSDRLLLVLDGRRREIKVTVEDVTRFGKTFADLDDADVMGRAWS